MADNNTNDDKTLLWSYDITPEHVRFKVNLADGDVYLPVDQETWDKINGEFSRVVHNAKPISEADLVYALQRIDSIRLPDYYHNPRSKLVEVVNMAKRADGKGYVLRVWENGLPVGNEREWNISTWGELEAMERAVYEAHR